MVLRSVAQNAIIVFKTKKLTVTLIISKTTAKLISIHFDMLAKKTLYTCSNKFHRNGWHYLQPQHKNPQTSSMVQNPDVVLPLDQVFYIDSRIHAVAGGQN